MIATILINYICCWNICTLLFPYLFKFSIYVIFTIHIYFIFISHFLSKNKGFTMSSKNTRNAGRKPKLQKQFVFDVENIHRLYRKRDKKALPGWRNEINCVRIVKWCSTRNISEWYKASWGYLKAPLGYLRVPLGYLRVPLGYLRAPLGCLRALIKLSRSVLI